MKKHELLSPAGNFECLRQAVCNGCDAVYLGGKKFGARKFATNFDEEELKRAVRYCHLYGVRLYVTVNTMVYEEELEECLDYIEFLHKIGVDALIMQDIGLIALARRKFPNLEIHASTQLHNHNAEGLRILKELGVKRVVLARELSLKEVEKLPDDLEKEVFIHGALCVSYSGQCLFSSCLLSRSGNRGACAGICRLPFQLLENGRVISAEGEYLLSLKELNTSTSFIQLLESNVTSFKIEGRMKSPAYVGWITKFYRSLIDQYEQTGTFCISDEMLKQMKVLYNRDFTEGFLFPDPKGGLANITSPNHLGIELGQVMAVGVDKISIRLTEPLVQEDGIRFMSSNQGMIVNFLYDDRGKLVHVGSSGEIIQVDRKFDVEVGEIVHKTLDSRLMKALEKVEEKKIPLRMRAICKKNTPLVLQVDDGKHTIEQKGPVIEEAKSAPLSKERLIEQLSKVGSTPFCLETLEVEMDDGIFFSIKALNEERRKILENLVMLRENDQKKVLVLDLEQEEICERKVTPQISVLVRTEEQLQMALTMGVTRIYVKEETLYEKYAAKENVFCCTPRVRTASWKKEQGNVLIGELGGILLPAKTKVTDYYLNITNHESLCFLASNGVQCACLSIEMTSEQIRQVMRHVPSSMEVEMFLYGRVEVMVTKYCPVRRVLQPSTGSCHLCRQAKYALQDRNQAIYPLRHERELTHIFHYKPENRLDEIKELLPSGINYYRLEFLEETKEEVEKIISLASQKLRECEN